MTSLALDTHLKISTFIYTSVATHTHTQTNLYDPYRPGNPAMLRKKEKNKQHNF